MKSRNFQISVAFVTVATFQSASAQTYHFSEVPAGLSIFGSPTVYSVTDKGEYLVVYSTITGPNSAFIFDGHKLTPVPAVAGDAFFALNTPGYLTGYNANNSFIQDKTGKKTLVTTAGGVPLGALNLNNLNVVVGQGNDDKGVQYGFAWKNGVVTQSYYYPSAQQTTFNGNNDLGDVVGSSSVVSTQQNLAFVLTKAGKLSLISVPNFSTTYAGMINNQGLVVGDAYNNGSLAQIGFYMTKKGKITTVDFGDYAPVAMPGPKGPLMQQKFNSGNNFWGVNNWVGSADHT